jgi:hypothetical protein
MLPSFLSGLTEIGFFIAGGEEQDQLDGADEFGFRDGKET